MGQEVLELNPSGKVLMTLGKPGVSGNDPDTFDRPAGVAVATLELAGEASRCTATDAEMNIPAPSGLMPSAKP